IIDDDQFDAERVSIGSTVILEDVELGEKMEYTIVGSMEADPMKAKISNESPVGSAILGQALGAVVDVAAPAGTIQYKIVNIKK
ncbi:MAG: GreA/GreB family elongation factor, partial [Bacillota bacterium]|nr:GreA/GreB family elongation factor [Bacillota bacterium]